MGQAGGSTGMRPDGDLRTDALATLCGGIAHEFNNLLTVIRGSAELAGEDGPDPATRARHLSAVVGAADQASRLTERLLAFARQQPLVPEPVDLRALFDVLRLELAAADGSIRVRSMVQTDVRAVSADPRQLASALRAAGENARDAMPDGGVLTFAAANDGDSVRITVADSGAGMEGPVAARAFDPFFTTKPVGEGSGLGLSQIEGFAAQSGGDVTLASAPGRGTTLVLKLPAADRVPQPVAAADVPPGARILLVEDSNTVAAFAEALLGAMGCAVTRAACASEALDRLAEPHARFDLMFSDIVMPGMSGIDLAEQVRREHPALPILLATGHSDQVAREGSRFPVLPKPYRRDALAQMMRRALAA